MRYSQVLIPYQGEEKKGSECKSYRLLKRAGYIRDSQNGSITFMDLGCRTIGQLEGFLDKLLGEKVNYIASNDSIKELLLNLASIVNSYKQLPLNIVKKGTSPKARNGAGAGLFNNSPLYTYSYIKLTQEERGQQVESIIKKLLNALDLVLLKAEGMDKEFSRLKCIEYLVKMEEGDREIVFCENCGYSVIKQLAEAPLNHMEKKEQEKPLEKVKTPNVVTVKLLADFMDCEFEQIVKTMIYMADGKPVAALVRGDRELSLEKLMRVLGCSNLEMANRQMVEEITGAAVGFAGPVGLNIDIIVDREVAAMKNFITGGNQTDYHYKNVNYPRDFKARKVADIRKVEEDMCPRCESKIQFKKGYTLIKIIYLDDSTAIEMKLTYSDKDGNNLPVQGSMAIFNLDRILAAVVEQKGCSLGISWPSPLRLFDVGIIIINPKKEEQLTIGEKIYKAFCNKGLKPFMEDSGRKLGVKFQTMDMMGIDKIIIVGKGAVNGLVEFKSKDEDKKEIDVNQIDNLITSLVKNRR